MSEEHPVSRRASLKGLGALGAAAVLAKAAPIAAQAAGKPTGVGQDKPPVNVVDVATGRFAKGHS